MVYHISIDNIFNVRLSAKAKKDLKKVSLSIALKLQAWVSAVCERGVLEVRRIPEFHDEPLLGKRKDQRSIRLNIAYRAIYIINKGKINFIEVVEIN